MSFPAGHESISSNQGAQRGCVLVVESDDAELARLNDQLTTLGFTTLLASTIVDARRMYEQNSVDMVMLDSALPRLSVIGFIEHINAERYSNYVPVLFMVTQSHEPVLLDCMSAGGDDFILKPFTSAVLNIRLASLEQLREMKNLYKDIMHEQTVARRILSAALSARTAVVHDMRVLSKSADIFCGDLVLTARHPDGDLLVLLADFTGHGLSAAIGVLPVADVFSVMSEKGFNPQQILSSINQKLLTLLPTGMFMAACMLKIHKDLEHASIWNGGMPEVLLLDNRQGNIKSRIASKHLPLGIASSAERSFKMEIIDISVGDQFIMYSDGLTDATNNDGTMFGTSRLHLLINNTDSTEHVFSSIVNAFEIFCEDIKPQDDVTLVNVPCSPASLQPPRSLQDAVHE